MALVFYKRGDNDYVALEVGHGVPITNETIDNLIVDDNSTRLRDLFLRFKKDEMLELLSNLLGLNGLSKNTREQLAEIFIFTWRAMQHDRAVLRGNNDVQNDEQDNDEQDNDEQNDEQEGNNDVQNDEQDNDEQNDEHEHYEKATDEHDNEKTDEHEHDKEKTDSDEHYNEKKPTPLIKLTVKRDKFDDDGDGFVLQVKPNTHTFKDIANMLYINYKVKADNFKFMFNNQAIDINHTVGKYSMEDFVVYLNPLMVGGGANGATRVRKNIIKQKIRGDPSTRATDTSIYESGFKGAEAILKLESVKISDFIKSLSASDREEVKNMLCHGKENNDVKLHRLAEFHDHGKPLQLMIYKAEFAMEHLKEVLQQSVIDEFGGRDGRFMTSFKKFVEDVVRLDTMQL